MDNTGLTTCEAETRPASCWLFASLAIDDIRIVFTRAWLVYALACFRVMRLHHLRTTATVEPSRTGGGDHSAKAVRAGRSPMVFGGRKWQADGLCDPRRSMVTRRIVVAAGWIARIDWNMRANHVAPRGAELCMDMVTA